MRRKLAVQIRFLGAIALAGVLAAIAGCGAGGVEPPLPSKTATDQAVTPVAAGVWSSIALPSNAGAPLAWAVAPDDPNTLFVCSGGNAPTGGKDALWRTHDGGGHWQRVKVAEATSGRRCEVAFATDDPRVIALAVSDWGSNWQPGSGSALYVSRDGGTTWRTMTRMPVLPAVQADGISRQTEVVVSSRALYLWYSYSGGGGNAGTRQVSALERTEDGGATWTRVDGAFGAGALFFPPRIGPDGALAVSVYVEGSGAAPSALWLSTDAGNSWRWSGPIPGDAGQMLLTAPVVRYSGEGWPATGNPFYALIAQQIPSALYRERVMWTEDGRQWAMLPPLPARGTNAVQYGIFQALAVVPDGRLLVFGADPRGTAQAQGAEATGPSQALWLWIWNPSAGQWSALARPLEFVGYVSGALGWQAEVAGGADGATYLYAADWFESGNTTLFRVRLPGAPAGT